MPAILFTIFGVTVTWQVLVAALQLVAHLWAFWKYNAETMTREMAPPKAAWFNWAVLSSINALSYLFLSRDLVTTILGIIDAVACIVTFAITLKFGGTTKFDPYEKVAMAFAVLAGLLGLIFHTAFWANTLIQFAILISFIQAWHRIAQDPSNESKAPWLIWTLVYCSNVGLVTARRHDWRDLVHPIVYVILHGVTWVLAIQKGPQKEGQRDADDVPSSP